MRPRRDVDAFVIACYSDPGLHMCREGTTRPVFGINDCGVLMALARGDRFGVLAIKPDRSVAICAICGRWVDRTAGGRATIGDERGGNGVGRETLQKMIEIGRKLRDIDDADVIIMGCAGMARHRASL